MDIKKRSIQRNRIILSLIPAFKLDVNLQDRDASDFLRDIEIKNDWGDCPYCEKYFIEIENGCGDCPLSKDKTVSTCMDRLPYEAIDTSHVKTWLDLVKNFEKQIEYLEKHG